MKTKQNWHQFARLCAVAFVLGGVKTAALSPALANRSASNNSQTLQLAQIAGECRTAKRSIFLYRDRSPANPLEALAPGESVILQEEDKNNGWIAVRVPSSGATGFVQTPDLTGCNATTSRPTPPPFPTPSSPPTRRPNSTTRPSPPRPSRLCRQVIYGGEEGMAVRSGPSTEAARVGGVVFGSNIFIDPASTRIDTQGREWVRLTAPLRGWMSNGFPAFPGDRNLASCS